MRIYLDDIRTGPDGFVTIRTGKQCVHELIKGDIEILSLDHDLGPGNKKYADGYRVAMEIVRLDRWPKEIYIHSMNPIGRDNIYSLLINYAPEGVRVHKYEYREFLDG